jgi:hypothetical protein
MSIKERVSECLAHKHTTPVPEHKAKRNGKGSKDNRTPDRKRREKNHDHIRWASGTQEDG